MIFLTEYLYILKISPSFESIIWLRCKTKLKIQINQMKDTKNINKHRLFKTISEEDLPNLSDLKLRSSWFLSIYGTTDNCHKGPLNPHYQSESKTALKNLRTGSAWANCIGQSMRDNRVVTEEHNQREWALCFKFLGFCSFHQYSSFRDSNLSNIWVSFLENLRLPYYALW